MITPCVSQCRLVNERCVSCKRTRQEISQWSRMTSPCDGVCKLGMDGYCSQRERIAELEEALRCLVDHAEHVESNWLVQGQEWESVTDAKQVLQKRDYA